MGGRPGGAFDHFVYGLVKLTHSRILLSSLVSTVLFRIPVNERPCAELDTFPGLGQNGGLYMMTAIGISEKGERGIGHDDSSSGVPRNDGDGNG